MTALCLCVVRKMSPASPARACMSASIAVPGPRQTVQRAEFWEHYHGLAGLLARAFWKLTIFMLSVLLPSFWITDSIALVWHMILAWSPETVRITKGMPLRQMSRCGRRIIVVMLRLALRPTWGGDISQRRLWMSGGRWSMLGATGTPKAAFAYFHGCCCTGRTSIC